MNWICSQCAEKFSRFRTRCPHEGARVIEDLSGQLVGGRYRIRELIGVGGMDSTVWKAWQTGTERTVAVKVLPPADEASARRFARGARIAANLNHPNCSVIHDYGKTDDGKLYLVMEFLQGQVLQEVLGGNTVMPVGDVVHIAVQVLQALEHAHSERAVHRDLKPDNLYLTRKNDDPLHVKILDFGIAKYVEEDPTDAEEKQSDGFEDLVTEQRQVCGTPQYMAPEQVVGARIDQRTDLYSLGCVMYRMLTGRLPFDGKTRYELYQKHLQEAPKPFADVRPDLGFPDRLELIVMKALMKRPDQRFQSASEMRKALESVDVMGDRARKNNRPRVALKETSPQQPGSSAHLGASPAFDGQGVAASPAFAGPAVAASPAFAGPAVAASPAFAGPPTILPPSFGHVAPGAAPFTLSQPAFVPQPPSVVVSPQLAPGPPPLPLRPAPLSAAIPARPLPSITEIGVEPAHSGNTLHAPAVKAAHAKSGVDRSSPLVPASVGASPRISTSLLNDAVLRHPPSRSTLSAVGPAVPRSTETQPNTTEAQRESRRRKMTVVAVLTGAFGLGVGGVALVMRLTQPSDASPRAPATPVPIIASPVGNERVGTPPAPSPIAITTTDKDDHAPGASALVADDHAPVASDPVASRQVPAEAEVRTRAGVGVGGALAEVALDSGAAPVAPAPSRVEVRISSEPVGAIVREGGVELGTTPAVLQLLPGHHTLDLERAGSKPGRLEVEVETIPGAGPIARKLMLEPALDPAHPKSSSTWKPETRPVVRPEIKPVDNKPVVEKPVATRVDAKPAVKLLEDGDPTPVKKPTVKLLDDDEATPPPQRPKVKVLDE